MKGFCKASNRALILALLVLGFLALAVMPAQAIALKNSFIRTSGVAGEDLSVGDIVCIKAADGYVYKANRQDPALRPAIGVVSLAATDGNGVAITTSGILSGYTGLTKGAPVYLDTDGNVTQTLPAIWSQQVGFATSATYVKFDFGAEQRRPPYVDATTHTATNTTTDGTSITMPAGTFAAGRSVKFTCGGTLTGTNAGKSVILYVDDAAIITHSIASASTGDWVATFVVTEYTDLAHQKVIGSISTGNEADSKSDYAVDTTDFADEQVIKTQVVSANASDTITQEYCLVEFF
jgi:hypothetical protein